MDGLKIADYANICRLCLCKGSKVNKIMATQEDMEMVKIVFDCTTIFLNPEEVLPHNICRKCTKRLTEFKTYRDYCMKNEELIRLHSLIHCEPAGSVENDINGNADDLQDIEDYVREEVQEELNMKGSDFIFGNQDDDEEDEEDFHNEIVIDNDGSQDEGSESVKKKRGRPKKTPISIVFEVSPVHETFEVILPSAEPSPEITLPDDETQRKSCRTRKPNPKFISDDEFVPTDIVAATITTNDFIVNEEVEHIIIQSEEQPPETEGEHVTPPMSPKTLAKYKRRKKNIPKTSHKYLLDKSLEKPKYYYYVTAKCKICLAILPRKDLKFHMNDHNGVYPYKCDQCDKSYSSPWKRKRHIKVVHVNELLVCNECGVSFKCKMNLVRHQRTTHEQVNTVDCEICERRFSCRDSLKRHLMTHTGERPHACTYCDRTFTSTFNLNSHIRSHTQEKPYKCDICGCTFGYPGVFKNHLEKVHKCITTSIRSQNKLNMNTHNQSNEALPVELDGNI